MKINNILYGIAAVTTLFMSACVNEQLETENYENEKCSGVYFVENQPNIKTHSLEKGVDKTSLDFIIRRANSEQKEEVQFSVEAYYIDTEKLQKDSSIVDIEVKVPAYDIFIFDKILFQAGESETKVNVRFDRITTGRTYYCNISITDPKYVSPYADNASSISFAVQMYEWRLLPQKAVYRDALMSDMWTDWKGRYLETEVEIWQRKDKAGYYRLHNLYDAEYMARLYEGDEAYNKDPEKMKEKYSSYVIKDHYVYLDATDPERVFFPSQYTGYYDPSYGYVYIASDVEEVFDEYSNHLYGKNVDQVITFPNKGLSIGVGQYYYISNTSGKTRIVLPGGNPKDYAVDVVAEEVTDDGIIPVQFTPAKDVAYIKYSIFKGKLLESDIETKVQEVKDAAEDKSVKLPASQTGDVQNIILDQEDETGIYTLVACSYDETDSYKEYSYTYMGYVKSTDDRTPEITMGMNTTDKYWSEKESENYDSSNSFEYWIRGKGITHAQISFYPTDYYNAYKDVIQKEMSSYPSLDGTYLKFLNSETGLSGVYGNTLKAGTSYSLIVYAKNEYRSKFFDKTFVVTSGEVDLMQKNYYYTDLIPEKQSIDKYTESEWVAVSIDIFDEKATGRTIRGKKNKEDQFIPHVVRFRREGDKMMASGLFPSLPSNPEITFDIKDNKLYSTENKLEKIYVRDSTNINPGFQEMEYLYRPKIGCFSNLGSFYDKYEDENEQERYDMITAGFVHDDIIAFTDNRTKHIFWTLTLGGYQSYKGEDALYNIIGDAHGDLILVRKGSELLEGLKGKSSNIMKEGQTLGSLTEQNRIQIPKFNTLISDLKKFEIAHEMITFSVK